MPPPHGLCQCAVRFSSSWSACAGAPFPKVSIVDAGNMFYSVVCLATRLCLSSIRTFAMFIDELPPWYARYIRRTTMTTHCLLLLLASLPRFSLISFTSPHSKICGNFPNAIHAELASRPDPYLPPQLQAAIAPGLLSVLLLLSTVVSLGTQPLFLYIFTFHSRPIARPLRFGLHPSAQFHPFPTNLQIEALNYFPTTTRVRQ